MKLGNAFHIVRGVKNLEETLGFYDKLGLKVLQRGTSPTNFVLYTDGNVNYLINEDNMTYTGLIYFTDSIESKVQELEKKGIDFFWKKEDKGELTQAMFEIVPKRFAVNLVSKKYDEKLKPSGSSIVEFGKFGELAVPVPNRDEIASLMHKIGFTSTHMSDGSDGHYSWGIMQDGLTTVGLHQTDKFSMPVPTYFDKNMDKALQKLIERGVELIDLEGGISKGYAMAKAPDGQIFYFFKGDI